MKAVVDQVLCIGCGLCCGTCPDVFRLSDEGKSEAYQEATEENRGLVQEAIDGCPVSAISWAE